MLTSTEVFPGRSTFEIHRKNSKEGGITGELLDTSDGAVELKSDGSFGAGKMVLLEIIQKVNWLLKLQLKQRKNQKL